MDNGSCNNFVPTTITKDRKVVPKHVHEKPDGITREMRRLAKLMVINSHLEFGVDYEIIGMSILLR